MNEEIRNNEIRDDELEEVSGGTGGKRDGICSVCGCNAYNMVIDGQEYLVCSRCGHRE